MSRPCRNPCPKLMSTHCPNYPCPAHVNPCPTPMSTHVPRPMGAGLGLFRDCDYEESLFRKLFFCASIVNEE